MNQSEIDSLQKDQSSKEIVAEKNPKKYCEWWQQEIKSAVRYRTVYGKAKQWVQYKNMYRGFWGAGTVPVNIIYATGRALIPQLYFRNPRVSITAKKPGYTPHAMVLERIDNYLIRETGVKYQLKSNILDCYLMGRGPGILGYDSEFGFNPKFTVDSMLADSGLTAFHNKSGNLIEYTDNIRPGMPWYMQCSPLDFVVPWGTKNFQDSRWFAFRKMRSKRDIQEDPKYENTKDIKGIYNTRLEGSGEGNSDDKIQWSEKDTDNEWCELWEVHDKRTGMVYTLTLDDKEFLRNEQDHLQFDSLPALTMGFNEDPDYFWWTPDARLIEVQQAELNDIRTMAKKHRRAGLLKMVVDKQIMPDELAKLLDEDVKSVCRVDVGAQGDIRKVVSLLQSHVPPDLIAYAKETREDLMKIIGFSRNQEGSFEQPSGRRTATEANIVQQASMIRVDERRDIVADHLVEIIRGYNRIIFENWNDSRVTDVVGSDGARQWVRFTGKELRGDYAYDINPEESKPMSQDTRKEDGLELLKLAMQSPTAGLDTGYLVQQIARQYDWLDPKLLFPRAGAGNNPQQALPFNEFQRRQNAGNPQSQTGILMQ